MTRLRWLTRPPPTRTTSGEFLTSNASVAHRRLTGAFLPLYSETLEELIALRKLKRATGGIDLERLNAGEKKKRRKVVDAEGKVTEDGMIEGTQGGIKDRTRDDPDE